MPKIIKNIDKIIHHLRLALGKMEVARNAYKKHKQTRGLDMLTIVSALHGIPINHAILAEIYISSSNKEIDKSIKLLSKLEKNLLKNNQALHARYRKDLLELMNLMQLARNTSSIEEKYEIISRTISELSEFRNALEKYNI
ncbi:hypothetical protein [Staphylothermus hellenicus]|uniref:PaREP1 family protein n=1 Tax=Staphylothermus hellenicus (strain DSM 12710 / JCM 10830 / BK20S6-10-b1 / P8) TaxID=591019 RepID=D7DCE0_STAHD|nr:hypothetical protein [Staphylothermus hellenicus]ADI31837.1 hypothetical protein Shell_0716 [Staphylothermus hellenicus DSM 12710]